MKLCIVGTGRSGTSLLWRLFNAHPDLFVFRETHWLPPLLQRFGDEGASFATQFDLAESARFTSGKAILAWNLHHHDLRRPALMRALAGPMADERPISPKAFCDILGRAMAGLAGKPAWGDKTPSHGLHMAEFARLWPECRFVHILRNGMAASASMAEHPGYRTLRRAGLLETPVLEVESLPQDDGAPGLGADFLPLWADLVTAIQAQGRQLADLRYIELRYEDLLAAPAAVLHRLAAFADLSAPSDWLQQAKRLTRADRRARGYDPEELERAAPAAGALMRGLGYLPSGEVAPLPPAAPHARATASTAYSQAATGPAANLLRDGTISPLDPAPIPPIGAEKVLLFCAGRNEAARLPHFLDHYRRLGVSRFFYIDNDSEDGSADFLRGQADLHGFRTRQGYNQSERGRLWTDALRGEYGQGHWCLTVDADELLVYPFSESLGLPALTAYLDEQKAEAMFTLMIDMYGEVLDAPYQPPAPFLEACPYFDAGPYFVGTNGAFPYLTVFGGVRKRLFHDRPVTEDQPVMRSGAPVLRKLPLVRWTEGMRYLKSTHSMARPCRLAAMTGALLHFKFLGQFRDFAREEILRGERPPGEYEVYQSAFGPEDEIAIHGPETARYRDSVQLIELGLIRHDKGLAQTVQAALKPDLTLVQRGELWSRVKKADLQARAGFQPQLGHALGLWDGLT